MPDSKDEKIENGGVFLSGWAGELWEITKMIVLSLAIVLPIRYYLVQPFIVRGASMEPNFEDREYLIIDELSYYFRSPERGEAIVFRYPRDARQFFIKRVIGLPGERLTVQNGQVKIFNSSYPDGFILEEAYLPSDRFTGPNVSITLGEDEFFVMGDNRDFSSDSRIWGALNRKLVVGRTLFRAWPFNKFGMIKDGSSYSAVSTSIQETK